MKRDANGGSIALTEMAPPRHNSGTLGELVRLIDGQTQRQVEDLQILSREGSLVVTGRSPSYYIKQLVTQAILRTSPSARLINEICVG